MAKVSSTTGRRPDGSTSVGWTRAVTVYAIACVLAVTPGVSYAHAPAVCPYPGPDDACADAEVRARADVDGQTWFLIGCLGGVVGWLVAEAVESNPPAAPLVGKDEVYVATYTDCYKRTAKGIKTKNAIGGCVAGTLASVAFVVVIALVVPPAEEQ